MSAEHRTSTIGGACVQCGAPNLNHAGGNCPEQKRITPAMLQALQRGLRTGKIIPPTEAAEIQRNRSKA